MVEYGGLSATGLKEEIGSCTQHNSIGSSANADTLEALAQESLKAQGAGIAACRWHSPVPCPVSIRCDRAGKGQGIRLSVMV